MTDDLGRIHAVVQPIAAATRKTRGAWERIETWLRQYAPTSAALLRWPATTDQIAAVEDAIGHPFPHALRAWYLLHDGSAGVDSADPVGSYGRVDWLPRAKGWLPLQSVQAQYELMTLQWEREPGLIPFACNPRDGWYGYYVDAREDGPDYGRVGTWAVDQESVPTGWALPDWLEAIATALEERRCLRRADGTEDEFSQPVVHEAGLTWIDPRDGFKDGMTYLRDLVTEGR
ncbi:SMI1/KNR4 family protein [Streptomyces sp. NPDC048751]|uniref:SMI1/KNR4 family protein n=1 Tax=Streptomyces sp. NPDC048751 TaxID=3365591 RepID=UPI00371637C1